MIITNENKDAIGCMYLHDGVFSGLNYDYEKRNLQFTCEQIELKSKYSLCFQNVVFFSMQSCGFWGESSRIYDIWLDDNPVYFYNLMELQKEKPDLFEFSLLDRNINFISVIIQLISGDELKITCESIDIQT